jgi:hypothetical protein
MGSLASALNELRGLVAETPLRLSQFSEAEASGPCLENGWSRKQILGHLLDSAANNHHRFVRAQIEDDFSMPSYAQNLWVATQEYQERSWNELIAFWAAYNTHLAYLMERAPKRSLANTARIGDTAVPVTLEFLMIDYVKHMKHHLAQLLRQSSPKKTTNTRVLGDSATSIKL